MRKKILLLDDEINFTFTMRRLLELTGDYEVRTATSSTSFLEVARAYRPDLMLLDCMMPCHDGGEIAGEIQADPILKGVPFMFLTATIDEPESRFSRCYSGKQMFLPKSLPLSDLCTYIENCLTSKDGPSAPLRASG